MRAARSRLYIGPLACWVTYPDIVSLAGRCDCGQRVRVPAPRYGERCHTLGGATGPASVASLSTMRPMRP